MGSRRAVSRGWALGGHAETGAGGDGEDDGPVWTPGPTSRSYLLSVRPETRSTFCSIIAQLTEETQPLFETTLKSRAVSADSDVRFTCIVTGYPEPEVTWYKDDMELDRYCGLPKYQITHQGNRHTLQLYRCQEDDAAIYQASARNTKGIVSCSGVLEVGTMTEYKIHQRWFAKLKRKAAAKMREMGQSWRQGPEAADEAEALRKLSPDRFQRKRRLSGAEVQVPPTPAQEAEDGTPAAWQEGEMESAQHPGLGLINSFAPGEAPTNGEPAPENGEDGEHGLLTYICEAMELRPQRAPQKETGAKKKRKDEESKPSPRRTEPDKAALSQRPSENGSPDSTKPDPCGVPGPRAAQQAQAQPRGSPAGGPGANGAEHTGKPASLIGTQDKGRDTPAPSPGPGAEPEVYFSLKDMYMESTQAHRLQGVEESPPLSTRAPGLSTSGKEAIKARGEGAPTAPSHPTPSPAPPPPRPFNRKRFAPPKPKGEPSGIVPPNTTAEHGAQGSGTAPPPASTSIQVPTPPARRSHGARDSPWQGRTGPRTAGEVLEFQAAVAPPVSASRTPPISGHQGGVDPMDTETLEEGSVGPTPGGQGEARAPGGQADGTPEDTTQCTQTDREMQDSERPGAHRSPHEDAQTVGRQTPTGVRAQEDLGDTKMQTGLSPPSRTPRLPPSEGLSSPLMEFVLTPEVSHPEKPSFVLRSEEPVATASRNHEHSSRGPPPGSPGSPAQEGSLEPPGWQERSDLVEDRLESGLPQCPKEQPWGEESSRLPATPVCPPQERLHSTPHGSTGALLPSGHQALLSSAPTLHLGPGPPAQSYPPGASAASHGGACARKVGEMEEEPSGARACDPGLIDSLKNYLLLLLKLSSTEPSRAGVEAEAPVPSPTPVPAVAGLSPCTSRRILERVENEHLVQSAQTLLLSPATTRRLTGLLDREVQAGRQALAAAQGSQGPSPSPSPLTVPAIVVDEDEVALKGPSLPESSQEGGLSTLATENSPPEPCQDEGVPGEAPTDLPAATPEELALGARRKRFLPKAKAAADGEASKPEDKASSPTVSPRGHRKSLAPGSPGTPGRERRSPTQGRKGSMLQVPRADEEPAAGDLGPDPKSSSQDAEPAPEENKPRKAQDLLKAPQVIRKIRVEQFPDASGSLKLWCQFFNIVSDSVLTWAKDQHPVGEVGRSAGDEGPAALAIVQASPVDCGMYRCTIHNEHGSASTDFCLSPEVLSGFVSREEAEVGEEIEMTPMVFAKGLADSGCWGDKLFGRLVSEELRGGRYWCGLRKASRARVIYGLEPIFESGRTCVIKVSSLLVFGPSGETSLLGRNYDVTIQGCKIQNMSREYCKIFAAEARAVPGFGEVPEIIPLYLIYRPANNIPYATLEEDLGEPLEPYCSREWGTGIPAASSSSEAVQKCQTFQHWLYQWTNGSFLVTDVAGIDWKMTDVQIATRLRGYQGLKESCLPALLDQFASSHQCNLYCEMLGLMPLKGPEAAHPQAKAKGSKSPSAGRKGPQLSPQPQKKGHPSPQGARKSAPSSKATPQVSEAAPVQVPGHPLTQEGDLKAPGMP
ncbi:alpha-protein kinase 3 isoform X2 [Perognathus longimembris pacificus]|uniref:alpha-protein kinase 3 isoform X2 n=1 Tax=Perognathus longimembris pacificus TaxID=214514 RepID=UPI0020184F6D|nr:alpha-protein kinase 3 isoform X2 [Perognathus longimembris pacificus]